MNTPNSLQHLSGRLLLAIALLLCVLISGANAQYRIGVHAGMNIANLDESGSLWVATNDHLIGFTGGATLEYPFRENLYAFLGLQFTQKGDALAGTARDISGKSLGWNEGTFRASYLEFPLGARYYFNATGIKPFVLGGIASAVLLTATQDIQTTPQSQNDLHDNMESTIFLYFVGAGLEFPLSGGYNLTFDVRQSNSFTSIIKYSGIYSIPGQYTSDLLLTVGVTFD